MEMEREERERDRKRERVKETPEASGSPEFSPHVSNLRQICNASR